MSKTYEHTTTGDRVKISKDEGTFYVLDNNTRIKKESFDSNFKEVIDPNDFLNSGGALGDVVNKLKNMDSSKLTDAVGQETSITYTKPKVLADSSTGYVAKKDEPEEKVVLTKDLKEKMIEDWKKKNPDKLQDVESEPYLGVEEVEVEVGVNVPRSRQKEQESKLDPVDMMFKMFKNNYDIKIDIEIEEKIADPTFIKLVMENVEGDPIEYYTKKILNKLMKDPLKLKKDIYEQVKKVISGEEEKKEE